MDKKEYKIKYDKYLDLFNDYCEKVFSGVKTNNNLAKAMKYSFFAGGKRIRPVTMLAYAEILNLDINRVLPFALALECIHTYSLIHDDLPALDNDVLRRGKPTNHVEFGEATAILAGDGLLNFAFEHALENINSKNEIKALSYLAKSSGYQGMLTGQKSDIEMEKSNGTEEDLTQIHKNKTCSLLTVSYVIPSILKNRKIKIAENFGYLVGLIFQFADDYLDAVGNEKEMGKTAGKDINSDKLTAVKFYGIDGVKKQISLFLTKAKNIAKTLDKSGFLQCFLHSITDWIYEN